MPNFDRKHKETRHKGYIFQLYGAFLWYIWKIFSPVPHGTYPNALTWCVEGP